MNKSLRCLCENERFKNHIVAHKIPGTILYGTCAQYCKTSSERGDNGKAPTTSAETRNTQTTTAERKRVVKGIISCAKWPRERQHPKRPNLRNSLWENVDTETCKSHACFPSLARSSPEQYALLTETTQERAESTTAARLLHLEEQQREVKRHGQPANDPCSETIL